MSPLQIFFQQIGSIMSGKSDDAPSSTANQDTFTTQEEITSVVVEHSPLVKMRFSDSSGKEVGNAIAAPKVLFDAYQKG